MNISPSSKDMVTIVEFTGLTGAGKTTLLNAVRDVLADHGLVAEDSYDLVLARFGLNLAPYPKLRSLLIDLVAFLPFLRYISTRNGFELLVLAIRVISRDAGGFLVALNLGRNFAKRIGMHVLLKGRLGQSGNCDFAVCDEGTLHLAHNLFVHTDRAPDPYEIAHFGKIVPKPDKAIWVRATQEQSIECILRRGHSRIGDSRNAARMFVKHGHLAFNILCSEDSVQEKLFTIDNDYDGVTDKSFSMQDSADAVAAYLTKGPMVRKPNAQSSPSSAR